jgi:CheY-like chemotaxis protein
MPSPPSPMPADLSSLAMLLLALLLPLLLFVYNLQSAAPAPPLPPPPPPPPQEQAGKVIESLFVDEDGSPVVLDKASLAGEVPKTVLIVDDDAVTRITLHRLFVQAGFTSQEVEDGNKAVEKYANGERFDLVVMDHDMPQLNGVDAIKALRTYDRHVTIMALTTHDPSGKEKEFLRVGANFVAPKPVTRSKLREVLQEYEFINW